MALQPVMLQRLQMFYPFPLFVVFIFTVILFLLKLGRKSNLPPSPPKLPIIGNIHQLSILVHRSLRDLSAKYGDLMLLQLGSAKTLVVSSGEMAKEITKTHDILFANRSFTTTAKALLYNCTDVGFAPYGEYWRTIKKITVIELLSIKRVQSFKFVREEEVSNMINEISGSKGAPVDLSEMISALSNNIVSRCALGTKVIGKDGHKYFGELSRELMELLGAFSFGDMFPWLGWMDVFTGLTKRMKKVSRELDTFLDQIIDGHINGKHGDAKDLLDILLHIQKEDNLEISLTRDNIKAIILNMLVGGSDTTSTTIEWAIAELIKNPNVMKKAQKEVRRVAGMKGIVDEEDINQMDYLNSVIKETLRLHPPVSLLIPRETYIGVNIKNYSIPPNTRVIINAWAIQRDPRFWDRAEEFIPERFTNNTIDFKGQDYEYIPFGSGRRGCPGIAFGVASVGSAVANLLYWFDWELPDGAKKEELDMTETFGLTVNKKTHLILVPVTIHSPINV